jgi:TRAP-type C4-dicarboxylate transport system permease small subunit
VKNDLNEMANRSELNKGIWFRITSSSIPKAISSVCQAFNIFGMTVLVMLTALTIADVLGRTLLKKPLLGTFELTEYMLTIIVFSSLAWCAVQGGHIRVDLLTSHLKPKVQAIMSSMTHLISLGLLVVITWQCFLEAKVMTDIGKTSALLNVPAYPFYWIMAAGFLILCLQIFVELLRYFYKAVKL